MRCLIALDRGEAWRQEKSIAQQGSGPSTMTAPQRTDADLRSAMKNESGPQFRPGVDEIRVSFRALDGFELGGMYVTPVGKPSKAISILICPGGGIPSIRYLNFARFMAEHGMPVLAFDYRGIGYSKPASLRGFEASVEDWSEHDCGGAIEYLAKMNPAAELVGIAHSIGSILLLGAPNSAKIGRFLIVCGHTGYYGDYHPKYRVPMAMLWHGIMPIATAIFGYFPGRMMRLGEDIPKGVALQWAAQRRPVAKVAPKWLADRGRLAALLARCKVIKSEAMAIGFADDGFATPAGLKRLHAIAPGLQLDWKEFSPRDLGLRRVGHFGFFRRAVGARLWPQVAQFALGKTIQRTGTY